MRISVSFSGRPEGSFAAGGGGVGCSLSYTVLFFVVFSLQKEKKYVCVRRGEVGGLGGLLPHSLLFGCVS